MAAVQRYDVHTERRFGDNEKKKIKEREDKAPKLCLCADGHVPRSVTRSDDNISSTESRDQAAVEECGADAEGTARSPNSENIEKGGD